MALKDKISKWHGSICFLEEGRYKEAIQKFLLMKNPSAKIIYNVACVHMLLGDIDQALMYFCDSIGKDKYLAVAYFLRGVCYCKHQRFDVAHKDFSQILSTLPREGINYQQLGAAVSLDVETINQWLQASSHARQRCDALPPMAPVMDFIFRPPKKMVTSLQKVDFLGKAKVISSTQEKDIVYAAEKKSSDSPPIPRRPKLPTPATTSSQPPPQPQARPRPRRVPPPPMRKPPELTASVKDRCRRRWKSMELLSDGRDEGADAAATKVSERPTSQRLDVDYIPEYCHLNPDNQFSDHEQGYFSVNPSLSASCPQIRRPPAPPPKRPNAPPSKTSSSSAQGVTVPRDVSAVRSTLNPTSAFDAKSTTANDSRVNASSTVLPATGISAGGRTRPIPPRKTLTSAGTDATSSENGQGSAKSVLARAHPALFKGLHLPTGAVPTTTRDAVRQTRQDVEDGRRRGPGVAGQQATSADHALLPNSPAHHRGAQERKTSPKPPRPQPPKIVR